MKRIDAKILYLIACCKKKLPGGSEPHWRAVPERPDENRFPELDESRRELVTYYSGLSEQEAFRVYTAPRGTKESKPENIRKAWAKNRAIQTSGTMPAIFRYQGTVFGELGNGIRGQMLNGDIGNVLIVSALFGMLYPRDLIPDYELVMKDKAPNGWSVYVYWRTVFRQRDLSEVLTRYMPSLEEIYCFMSESTGYVPAVQDLANDFNVFAVSVTDGSTRRSTKAWGRSLRRCLEKRLSSWQDIEAIVEAENCSLIQL